MERDLDALDVRLLRAMLNHGELSPTELAVQRRLDRLEVEGHVTSVPQDVPPLESALTWVYRLTEKGRQTASDTE